MIRLYKNKPWYKAGKLFGWGEAGLGIDCQILQRSNDDEIIQFNVRTKNVPYYISVGKAKEIIKDYDSVYYIKGCPVGIVPFSSVKPTRDNL